MLVFALIAVVIGGFVAYQTGFRSTPSVVVVQPVMNDSMSTKLDQTDQSTDALVDNVADETSSDTDAHDKASPVFAGFADGSTVTSDVRGRQELLNAATSTRVDMPRTLRKDFDEQDAWSTSESTPPSSQPQQTDAFFSKLSERLKSTNSSSANK